MEFPSFRRNHRIVPEDNSSSSALKLGLIMWVVSTYWFKKQIYIKDKNMFNLMMFSAGSLFSSVAISRTLLETPYSAAIRANNIEEARH